MKTIGIIGGMSAESTVVYYRQLNALARARYGGLHSARILMSSLDFEDVAALQRADDWEGAGKMLADAGRRLEGAGADAVLIATNTMHIVADDVRATLRVPLIDIIDATGSAIAKAGYRRPGLLATRFTMERDFYRNGLMRHGLEPLVPEEADRMRLHEIIFAELCCGVVCDRARADVAAMAGRLEAAGADCLIFGCTEIGLLGNAKALPLPVFDTTDVHVAAAFNFMTASDEVPA